MSKPKALVTRPLFPAARAILDQHFNVEYWTSPERISRAELLKRVAEKDALVCLLTEKVDEELLALAPKLRVAATVSVGYDNIDVPACTRHKVVATHTPGVLDQSEQFPGTFGIAQRREGHDGPNGRVGVLAPVLPDTRRIGLDIAGVARRLVEGDAWMRTGTWPGWDLDQLLGGDVWGKTLGIVGFGRIGRGLARRAQGFQMRVLYHDQVQVAPEVKRELHAEFAAFDGLLGESDFISLHVPLLPETRHLISTAAFEKMKRTAYLINTSRGPVVDEAALAAALEQKKIAGAALDVYEHEPKVSAALIARKDVILAPHIASATVDTRTKMAVMAATNAAAVLEGRRPPNALNADALGL